MSQIWKWIIVILIVGCAADEQTPTIEPSPTMAASPKVAASPTTTCAKLSASFMEEAVSIFEEWDNAIALASSTSRINLSGPVASLAARCLLLPQVQACHMLIDELNHAMVILLLCD